MIKHIKFLIYLIVLFGFSIAIAGSYDDFFAAIRQNNDQTIRALLRRGFDPNTLSPTGEPGLILAVNENSFKSVAALLESSQTNVELRTLKDESALMLAALRGHIDLCRQLIARDADVNKPGWTPLHYAAMGGHIPILKLLLENHAYIDASSPNGSTPLMMAARYGTLEAVQLLLDEGADPSLKNDLGLTAIDFAGQHQREHIVSAIAAVVREKRKSVGW